jgi:hypothetical protein
MNMMRPLPTKTRGLSLWTLAAFALTFRAQWLVSSFTPARNSQFSLTRGLRRPWSRIHNSSERQWNILCQPQQKRQQRNLQILFVSSASSSSSSNTAQGKAKVVYQKIVKDPASLSGSGNPLFLGQLVEYLQDHFQLPDKLPMIYESAEIRENDKRIASWDSPMSPSPDATRLDMEVVAIYKDGDQNTIPNMAMVVVKKAATDDNNKRLSTFPSPMMQNLFADSEKRILRALDRGLDDFMAGKIKFKGTKEEKNINKIPKVDNYQAAQDAMIEEFLADSAENHASVLKEENRNTAQQQQKAGTTILDAEILVDSGKDPQSKEKTSSAEATKDNPAASAAKTIKSDTKEDFAVKAARQAARNKREAKSNRVDFAVAAAQKVAASKKKKGAGSQSAPSAKKSSMDPSVTKAAASTTPPKRNPSQKSSSASSANKGHERAFRETFSTPEVFQSEQKQKVKKGGSAKATQKSQKSSVAPQKPDGADPGTRQSTKPVVEEKERKRKLNLRIVDEDGNELESPSENVYASSSPQGPKPSRTTETSAVRNTASTGSQTTSTSNSKAKMPSDEEIMKTAQEIMAEIAEQGTDLSAQELLQDVLKFGEQ